MGVLHAGDAGDALHRAALQHIFFPVGLTLCSNLQEDRSRSVGWDEELKIFCPTWTVLMKHYPRGHAHKARFFSLFHSRRCRPGVGAGFLMLHHESGVTRAAPTLSGKIYGPHVPHCLEP